MRKTVDKSKSLVCMHCSSSFDVTRMQWKWQRYAFKAKGQRYYCSKECRLHARGHGSSIEKVCSNCFCVFKKFPSQIRGPHDFCSKSCSATFTNKNKTHGTRVSKLEAWLQQQLTILFPDLLIIFNGKEAIKSELDVFIPSLHCAFELNGIFHYEPIFGELKHEQIKANDLAKVAACNAANIRLHIIDTTLQKTFTESSSIVYLNYIKHTIEELQRVQPIGIEPMSSA